VVWRKVLDVIKLDERPSMTGNFPPSRSALRLGEELKIVPWSELKPHIDVFEADGKVRTGLLVGNNPINWIDPFGLATISVGKCEIVIAVGHQNKKKPHQFKFTGPCSYGAFVGCWPGLTNKDSSRMLPSAQTHQETMERFGNLNKDIVANRRQVSEAQGITQDIDKNLEDLQKEATDKARGMKDCCPNGVKIKIIDLSGGEFISPDFEATVIPR